MLIYPVGVNVHSGVKTKITSLKLSFIWQADVFLYLKISELHEISCFREAITSWLATHYEIPRIPRGGYMFRSLCHGDRNCTIFMLFFVYDNFEGDGERLWSICQMYRQFSKFVRVLYLLTIHISFKISTICQHKIKTCCHCDIFTLLLCILSNQHDWHISQHIYPAVTLSYTFSPRDIEVYKQPHDGLDELNMLVADHRMLVPLNMDSQRDQV